VDERYPFDERREVLPFVPPSARRILDVGCGRGGFGYTLREADPSRTIWGVEADLDFVLEASPHYDEILQGTFPDVLSSCSLRFDCIVFNDVLEHMVDPWEALRAARAQLAPGGTVVASIPNVRNLRTLFDLVVRGQWTYVDMGVLDRTHLRFFTKRSILAFFRDSGFVVEALGGIHALGRSHSPLVRAVPRLTGELAYTGFALRARPADDGPSGGPSTTATIAEP
jgi:2-polyprenyl-3-methyl-5-hydroxy-6-metoxy-1,4-benzoquinol methylase